MTEITNKWDNRHMDHAFTVASYSKDPSTKVGCVAVDDYNSPVCMGFNGIPRKVGDRHERLIRPLKLKYCLHAEQNMIANSARKGTSLLNTVVYVTHIPCSICAGLLISAGVKEVKIPDIMDESFKERWKDDIEISTIMFIESGVKLTLLNYEVKNEIK